MKTKMIAVFVALVFMTGCQDGTKNVFATSDSEAVSVLNDRTDQMTKPQASDILGLYGINDDKKYNGFLLRARNISDVSLEPVKEFQVNPETWINADDIERVRQIKEFESDFSKWYAEKTKPVTQPKKYSLVYRAIAEEANQLAGMKTVKTRTLIVCSDLEEHSLDLDLYNARDVQLVQSKPQVVMGRLEKVTPLKPLDGVKVFFVYQPKDYRQQQQFDIASRFFKQMLEEKGATVVITANLTAQN